MRAGSPIDKMIHGEKKLTIELHQHPILLGKSVTFKQAYIFVMEFNIQFTEAKIVNNTQGLMRF